MLSKLAELLPTLREVVRVLRVLRLVEDARQARGPQSILSALRDQAAQALPRDERGRRCLRRAILWVDGAMGDGGNCYRRSLLEMALDRNAAALPFAMGFSQAGDHLTGHAWLAGEAAPAEPFDFVIQL
jgi:hypothetical protein